MLADVRLTINGTEHELTIDTRTSLLDLLREQLDLTGAKKGCDHGQCGACTVLIDGRRANGCLALAVAHDGAEIDTIEGLGRRRAASPAAARVHRARRVPVRLLHAGADVLGRGHAGRGQAGLAERGDAADRGGNGAAELTDAEIRERMSGNLCRCGAYANIVPAIAEAAAGEAVPLRTRGRRRTCGGAARRRAARRATWAAGPTWST